MPEKFEQVAPGWYEKEGLPTEEQEEFEKLRQGAENVIKCFGLKRASDNSKGENLLIITDMGAETPMIQALHEAGEAAAGKDCRLLVFPKTEHAAQGFDAEGYVGDAMKGADAVLLVTSFSRSHSKEMVDLLFPGKSDRVAELIAKRKREGKRVFPIPNRVISITNTSPETFIEGGALEDPQQLKERVKRFTEATKGVERVRITSENGTDLEVDIKMGTVLNEDGMVDKPGMASNFPIGETGGAVDLEGTNGVYVVDGAIGMIGRVDKPVKITIEKGIAIKIEGGEAADKLRAILGKADQEYKKAHPEDKVASAYRLAEFAFGMNSKAFRYEDGKRVSPPTSLEGEKGLGTVHIALGKNTLFGVPKEDPDYNDIPIHIDCVAMEPNVVGIKDKEEEIDIIEKGEVVCI